MNKYTIGLNYDGIASIGRITLAKNMDNMEISIPILISSSFCDMIHMNNPIDIEVKMKTKIPIVEIHVHEVRFTYKKELIHRVC
ncbi:MAG: hypothetical protein N2712_03420 [Brevinematales bacterium]|nr:hypothetical protein [Brevinematales bacterium]